MPKIRRIASTIFSLSRNDCVGDLLVLQFSDCSFRKRMRFDGQFFGQFSVGEDFYTPRKPAGNQSFFSQSGEIDRFTVIEMGLKGGEGNRYRRFNKTPAGESTDREVS